MALQRILMLVLVVTVFARTAAGQNTVTSISVNGSPIGNSATYATATISYVCDPSSTFASVLVWAVDNNQLIHNYVGQNVGNFSATYTPACPGNTLTISVGAQYENAAQQVFRLAACATGFQGVCTAAAVEATVTIQPPTYNITNSQGTMTMVRTPATRTSQRYQLISTCAGTDTVLTGGTTLQWTTSPTPIYSCGPTTFASGNGTDFPAIYQISSGGGAPPSISLFLDVDGFNVNNPTTTDDKAWYVPCSLKNGTSVSPSQLPQRVNVIAAYVDSAGTIVAPPTSGNAVLSLTDISRFKGIAMNASKAGRDDAALDFEAPTTSVAFANDHTARFEIQCWDYGGHATATVTHNSQTTTPLQLPRDSHGNWIADAVWVAGTAQITDAGQSQNLDDDNTPTVSGPPSGGVNGDGLFYFEEYRGFVVRGEHRRTNPFQKDLFLSSNATVGIAFAFPNLPTATHRINGEDETGVDEYRTADRVVNFNYQNTGHGGDIPGRSESNNQKAVRVLSVANAPSSGLFGQALPPGVMPGLPNDALRVEVYVNSHTDLKKAPLKYSNAQVDNELRRTLAHEVGHAIHICHRTSPASACPDGATVGTSASVMNSNVTGTPESDPNSQYNPADIAQIRLRN